MRPKTLKSASPCCGACRAFNAAAPALSVRELFHAARRRRKAEARRRIELMLVTCRPAEPDNIARPQLAEAILPHQNWLATDLAKHDAVRPEMLDALYLRRLTVLRHQADLLGANADQPPLFRYQVHRRRTDKSRGEGGRGPAVEL